MQRLPPPSSLLAALTRSQRWPCPQTSSGTRRRTRSSRTSGAASRVSARASVLSSCSSSRARVEYRSRASRRSRACSASRLTRSSSPELLTLRAPCSGVTRFNIHKAAANDALPSAHTCFNRASRSLPSSPLSFFALSCLPAPLVLTQGPLADDDMLMHAELDLPSGYESYEQFRQKLLLAITEVRSSLLTLPRLLTLPCSLFRSSTSFSFSY